MNVAFDQLASAYDREFTFSRIGIMQRREVWNYMNDMLLTSSPMDILELNCGTGIDAVFMARHGHRVLATDISGEMLKMAQEKAMQCGAEDKVTFRRLGFHQIKEELALRKFDMAFSNFGGLNCIDRNDLGQLGEDLADKIRPSGRLIAVIMPDRCMMESIYFTLKSKPQKAFRRGRKDSVIADLSGTGVATWYHSPKEVTATLKPYFRLISVRPIGLVVPPSYMEPFFSERPRTLNFLGSIDSVIAKGRFLARYADHFLIDMERRR